MESIPLRDFVSNVLIEIAQGVHNANDTLKDPNNNQFEVFNLRRNIGDSAKIPGIQFDVAVTASSESKEKVGFMVTLVNIGGGAATEKAIDNVLNHRIRFEVGIFSEWR